MGEAKRRTEHAPVLIIDPTDPQLAEAHEVARRLLTLCREINGRLGNHQLSSGYATAIQTIALAHGSFSINDTLNGLTRATAWALHPMPELGRIGALASMAEQIMVMAQDSEAAVAFKDTKPQGQA